MNNISTRDDTSCNYTNLSPGLSLQMYSNITDHHDQDHDHRHHDGVNNNNNNNMNAGGADADADADVVSAASAAAANSLVYGLSILKDKVSQLHSLAGILLSAPPDSSSSSSASAAAAAASSATMSSIHNAIQEIIMTSSSMLLTFQHHMGLVITSNNSGTNNYNSAMTNIGNAVVTSRSSQLGQALIYPSSTSNDNPQSTVLDWPYGHDDQTYNNNSTITTNKYYNNNNNNMIMAHYRTTSSTKDHHDNNLVLLGNDRRETSKGGRPGMVEVVSPKSASNYDIVELDASDLLAKYTHYCQVCGKGFKRDANLRMHMRAHGDEYKTSAALSNPMKKINDRNDGDDLVGNFSALRPKKYSCPQEGCRWNQRHAKFQPLKSMICVKNHYKRSHCPKMYVCKRCNRKQFSVLSDLRTHEKHCGDLKWQCSCGTTFSRKDKLMGHVTLFVGHTPVMLKSSSSSSFSSNIRIAKVESQVLSQSQIDSIVNMIE